MTFWEDNFHLYSSTQSRQLNPKTAPLTLPRALQQDYIFCMAVTLDSVQCPPQFSREQRIFYCACFCYYYFAVLYDQPVFHSWPHLAFKGSYSKDILMCTSMWVNSWLFFVFVCFLQKRMKKKKKHSQSYTFIYENIKAAFVWDVRAWHWCLTFSYSLTGFLFISWLKCVGFDNRGNSGY